MFRPLPSLSWTMARLATTYLAWAFFGFECWELSQSQVFSLDNGSKQKFAFVHRRSCLLAALRSGESLQASRASVLHFDTDPGDLCLTQCSHVSILNWTLLGNKDASACLIYGLWGGVRYSLQPSNNFKWVLMSIFNIYFRKYQHLAIRIIIDVSTTFQQLSTYPYFPIQFWTYFHTIFSTCSTMFQHVQYHAQNCQHVSTIFSTTCSTTCPTKFSAFPSTCFNHFLHVQPDFQQPFQHVQQLFNIPQHHAQHMFANVQQHFQQIFNSFNLFQDMFNNFFNMLNAWTTIPTTCSTHF
jgi:hypothetical protein